MTRNSHSIPDYQSDTIRLPLPKEHVEAIEDHMDHVPLRTQFPRTTAVVTIRFEINPDDAEWPTPASNVLAATGSPRGATALVYDMMDWEMCRLFGITAVVAHTKMWSGVNAQADLKSNREVNLQALRLAQALEDNTWE